MSKLTAKKVENALPRKKKYKPHDGDGLFLRIRPSGAKHTTDIELFFKNFLILAQNHNFIFDFH